MSFYSKYILPKYLDKTMDSKDFEKPRAEVLSEANGIVAEIGFGSGLNIPYYKNINKLYAIDPSRKSYEIAKDRIIKASFPVEYLEVSAENIPLTDNSVDYVVSTWNLCTIPNPETALREVSRILKPGGKFLFVEHGISPSHFVHFLQNIFTPFSRGLAGGCHMNRDIEKIISSSGLKIEKMEKFYQKFRPLAFLYKGLAVK